MRLLRSLPLGVVLFLTACATTTVPRSELAPSGAVRVAINYGNPALATKDPQSGELRGVAIDISRELGRRASLAMELVPYETAAAVMAARKAGAWDVAFLAADPARASEVAFTAPYMEVEVTYLVPQRSGFEKISDVDRAGVRIAVQEKNAADLFLSRTLKQAVLVRARNESGASRLLTEGDAEALASNKQGLLRVIDGHPGYRMLEGRFTTIPHAIAVPAAREAAARHLARLVEEQKASGFIALALERAQLRGVVVAPPAVDEYRPRTAN